MSINPITFTVNPWLFIAFCILFAAQVATWIVCIIELLNKPKRKKRH